MYVDFGQIHFNFPYSRWEYVDGKEALAQGQNFAHMFGAGYALWDIQRS